MGEENQCALRSGYNDAFFHCYMTGIPQPETPENPYEDDGVSPSVRAEVGTAP